MKSLPLLVLLALSTTVLPAASKKPLSDLGKNTVAISLMGSYPGTLTDSAGNKQTGDGSSGVLFEFERINNPFFGYNISYGLHGGDQTYDGAKVKAHAHEFAADWELSTPTFHVMPVKLFFLAGFTHQSFSPSSGQADTKSDSKWGVEYGFGLNYSLMPHVALRGQYRQDRYSAPRVANGVTVVGMKYHQSEPMIGLAVRF